MTSLRINYVILIYLIPFHKNVEIFSQAIEILYFYEE